MVTHNSRQTDRAPFFAEIDVLATDTPTPRRLWGGDVSEDGMFLQTTHPYRVGDRVALRFDLDEHEVHVRAAEVMWVRPFEPISVDGRSPGVGLRFVAVDPPARAALRRLVRYASGEHRAGDTTLPEMTSQAIMQQSQAPARPATRSLTPATQNFQVPPSATKSNGTAERTDEMLAISIAPFTDPPRAEKRQASIDAVLAPPMCPSPSTPISLPPDEPALDCESRVFHTPAAVTLGPKRVSKPPSAPPAVIEEHPFAGWVFRKVAEAEAPATSNEEPPGELGLSFDDERPGSLLESAAAHGCDDFDSEPSELGGAAVLVRDEEPAPITRFTHPCDGAALSALPVAAERRSKRGRAAPRLLPVAAALLCSGALLGIGVGVVSKRIERRPAPDVVASAATADAADAADATSSVASAAPLAVAAATARTEDNNQLARSVADVERPLAPVDVVAGAIAKAPTAMLTKKAHAPKPKPTPAKADSQANVEVAVGAARVLKTFTLAGPHRVVVDLADATLPGQAPKLDEPGVTRVRFGTPTPGTSRVVVEVERAAHQAKARVVDGQLIISFAS